jgi:hypothetical protein
MNEEIKQMLLSNNSIEFIREYDLFNMYSVCKKGGLMCTICEEEKTEEDFPPRLTNKYYCCKDCYILNSAYRGLRAKFKEAINS